MVAPVKFIQYTDKEALLSPCGKFRYALWRRWTLSTAPRMAVWIGLNPSTADARKDDPTIRRMVSFSKLWQFDGICVVNLFAYRSKDPNVLLDSSYFFGGPDNSKILRSIAGPIINGLDRGVVVAAWGAHPTARLRSMAVIDLIGGYSDKLRCLGMNKDGSPKHPLYVSSSTPLIRYTPL